MTESQLFRNLNTFNIDNEIETKGCEINVSDMIYLKICINITFFPFFVINCVAHFLTYTMSNSFSLQMLTPKLSLQNTPDIYTFDTRAQGNPSKQISMFIYDYICYRLFFPTLQSQPTRVMCVFFHINMQSVFLLTRLLGHACERVRDCLNVYLVVKSAPAMCQSFFPGFSCLVTFEQNSACCKPLTFFFLFFHFSLLSIRSVPILHYSSPFSFSFSHFQRKKTDE